MKKKKNSISNLIFDFGVALCLAPINIFLRGLPYPIGVIMSVASIIFWGMPLIVVFSIISNIIFAIEVAVKLIKQ